MDISIIICTCNRASFLKETLESMEQAVTVYGNSSELIVVDNGSTDTTPDVVRAFPQFRMCRETKRGLSAARNRGILESKGRVILFTDDDIRVAPDWIQKMSNPILTGATDAVTGTVKLAGHLERPWMTAVHRGWLAAPLLSGSRPPQMTGASMGFGRHVLTKVPSFDEELGPGVYTGTADDQLFSYQLEAAKFTITTVHDAYVWHHFEPERLKRSAWIRAAGISGRSMAYIDHHWAHKTVPMVQLCYLAAQVRYHLRKMRRWRECLAPEGIAEWELHSLASISRLAGFRRERKRSPNYELRGLVKLTTVGS